GARQPARRGVRGRTRLRRARHGASARPRCAEIRRLARRHRGIRQLVPRQRNVNDGRRLIVRRLLPHRAAWLATLLIVALAVALLFAMDRPPICTCGEVKLWHGVVQSNGNSQHVTDWYSPSHFTHGLIMYFFAWLLWRRWKLFGGRPARWALPIAVLVEAAWEVIENTPMVIDRYRAVTVSWGYTGDSILN